MKKYTVFLDTPTRGVGEPPYWIEIKAGSVAAAITKARMQAAEDYAKAGCDCAPDDEDFPCELVVLGWNVICYIDGNIVRRKRT